mmetsp:Transcript_31900/g.36429  ORF Transcript_31900/g.36429 Transcript_31900/m.36429 type:complete len:80 (+) Transcript_31900:172-411(+)
MRSNKRNKRIQSGNTKQQRKFKIEFGPQLKKQAKIKIDVFERTDKLLDHNLLSKSMTQNLSAANHIMMSRITNRPPSNL